MQRIFAIPTQSAFFCPLLTSRKNAAPHGEMKKVTCLFLLFFIIIKQSHSF
jgi:hypothetical protein